MGGERRRGKSEKHKACNNYANPPQFTLRLKIAQQFRSAQKFQTTLNFFSKPKRAIATEGAARNNRKARAKKNQKAQSYKAGSTLSRNLLGGRISKFPPLAPTRGYEIIR